jgi:hypothetical protein
VYAAQRISCIARCQEDVVDPREQPHLRKCLSFNSLASCYDCWMHQELNTILSKVGGVWLGSNDKRYQLWKLG